MTNIERECSCADIQVQLHESIDFLEIFGQNYFYLPISYSFFYTVTREDIIHLRYSQEDRTSAKTLGANISINKA